MKVINLARKLVLEKTLDDMKTVSARIPLQLFNDFHNLNKRAKTRGYTLSLTNIIILALTEAVAKGNAELDKIESETAELGGGQ